MATATTHSREEALPSSPPQPLSQLLETFRIGATVPPPKPPRCRRLSFHLQPLAAEQRSLAEEEVYTNRTMKHSSADTAEITASVSLNATQRRRPFKVKNESKRIAPLVAVVEQYRGTYTTCKQEDNPGTSLSSLTSGKRCRQHTTGDSVVTQITTTKNRLAQGCSTLMYACQQGHTELVIRELRTKPERILQRDSSNKSVLHYCTGQRDLVAAASVAIAAPELLEAADEDGFTPLHLAVIQGNLAMVNLLLANKADVNVVDNEGHSVVHWATVCGEVEALRAVLQAGANVTTPDINGGSPLHYAAQMCGACYEGKLGQPTSTKLALEILAILLAHPQSSVDVQDKDGRQPLLWAASAGSAKAVIALVKAGARVESADKDGLTALHCAASRGHTECIDTIISLCGAPTDLIDSNGCTALHYAVTLGHADATSRLLELEADPNRQDRKGRTPAHCGCSKGQFETVKLLKESGANLWLRNAKGDLPMHEAASSGRRELVEWLLQQRPKQVNTTSNDGRSLLHISAAYDYTDMCKMLLDFGADINSIYRNSKGLVITPLDCALQKGHRSTAKFIQSNGGLPASKLRLSAKRANPFHDTFNEAVKPLKYAEKEELHDLKNSKKYVVYLKRSDSDGGEKEFADCSFREHSHVVCPRHQRKRFYRRRTISCGEPKDFCKDDSCSDICRSKSNIEIRRRRSRERRAELTTSDDDDEDSCENCCYHKRQKQRLRRRTAKKPREPKSSINENEANEKFSEQKSEDMNSDNNFKSEINVGSSSTRNNQNRPQSAKEKQELETTTADPTIVKPNDGTLLSQPPIDVTDDDDNAGKSVDIVTKVDVHRDADDGQSLHAAQLGGENIESGVSDSQQMEEDNKQNKTSSEPIEEEEKEKPEEKDYENDKLDDKPNEDLPVVTPIDTEMAVSTTEPPVKEVASIQLDNLSCSQKENDEEQTKQTENVPSTEEVLELPENVNTPATPLASPSVIPTEATVMTTEPPSPTPAPEPEPDHSPTNPVATKNDVDSNDRQTSTRQQESRRSFTLLPPDSPDEIQQIVRKSSFHVLKSDESLEDQELGNSHVFVAAPETLAPKSDSDVELSSDSGAMGPTVKEVDGGSSAEPPFRRLPPSASPDNSHDHSSGRKRRLKKRIKSGTKNKPGWKPTEAPPPAVQLKCHRRQQQHHQSSKDQDSGFEPSPRAMKTKIPSPRNICTAYLPRKPIYATLDKRSCSSRIENRKPGDKGACDMSAVTRSIQRNVRRYYMERKIFQHLLALKSLQIRSNKINEAVLVKRAVDDYHRSCIALGSETGTTLRRYPYITEYTFKNFELFLYETLKAIQKPGTYNFQNINEVYEEAERRLSPDYNAYEKALQCTTKTHRCWHAVHAYTGIPCAAYIPMMNHHTMPKFGFGTNKKPGAGSFYLPKILNKQNGGGKVSVELSNGKSKQLISLPSEKLDSNKRYYVTFTVKKSTDKQTAAYTGKGCCRVVDAGIPSADDGDEKTEKCRASTDFHNSNSERK